MTADVLAAAYGDQRSNYWGLRWYHLIPAVLFAFAVIAIWRRHPAENPFVLGVVIVTGGSILVFLYWSVGRWMALAHAAAFCQKEFREGLATSTFIEEGLVVEVHHCKTLFEWAAFESIRRNASHLFLTLSSQHDGQVFVIPRRFFHCDEDWAAACLVAERNVKGVAR